MKILFVCNNVFRGNDSTSNIVNILLDYLKNKHEIFVLSKAGYNDKSHKCFKKRGIKYILFHPLTSSEEVSADLVENYDWKGKDKFEKILFLLLHPTILFGKIIYKIQGVKGFEYIYKYKIKYLDKKYKFDAIIATTAPYGIARALAKVNIHGKKILYELDPYYTNYIFGKGKDKRYLREEQQVLKNMDLAIMTDLIYNENQNNELSIYSNKMKWIEYPNVRELNIDSNEKEVFGDSKRINCFFIGTFYDEFRTPDFVLNIFSRMKNKDITLHFVGCGGETETKRYKEIMGERLQIHGRVTRERALFFMKRADILVEVNNSIRNQMPGKIFDYISAGRPILNFCYLDECPSLKYMEKYPLVMNIFEKQRTDINIVEEFCEKNKGKYLPFEEIKALFNENTVETVGSEFDRLIGECIRGLKK